MIKLFFENFFKIFFMLCWRQNSEIIGTIVLYGKLNVEYLKVFEIQETWSKNYFFNFLNAAATWKHQ